MNRESIRQACLEVLEQRQLMSTYYVSPSGSDSAAGTTTAPWKTLQNAADAVKAGDTVIVRAGNYAGFVMGWDGPVAGTAAAPIVWKADPGATIVSRDGKTPDGIDLEGGDDYVVIDGFTINNGGASGPGGIGRADIRVAWSNHVTIQNCNTSYAGTWGIYTSHSDDLDIEHNITHDNNGDGTGWNHHGIYIANSALRPIVKYNTIYHNVGNGLHLNGDATQGGDGLVVGALIEGNIIYDNGINGGNAINADGLQNSIIRNNLLYNNHVKGIALYQTDAAGGPKNNIIVNNTIDMASDAYAGVVIKNNPTNNQFYNNVVAGGKWSIVTDSGKSGMIANNNAYVGGALFSPDDGSTQLSFASWQSSLGFDKNGLTSTQAALFVNAAGRNYHLLATSPAIDKGTSTDAPLLDLEANNRPAGAGYDIGALEYGATGGAAVIPTAPSSAVAKAISYAKINLTWKDNSDNESGFKIERMIAGGAWTQIALVGPGVTSYDDLGLTPSTQYSYRVRATNGTGDSAYSNVGVDTTLVAPAPPLAPAGASGTALTWSSVKLTWLDNSSNEDGFKIERCIVGGTFAEIGRVGADVTTFTDTGLTPSTQYSYRVRAWNAGGHSGFCPSANVTTPTLAAGSYTVFGTSATPLNPSEVDGKAVELGMKFIVDVDGFITGVRFYKGSTQNGGTHVANLWSADGAKLATASFTAETSSGWQQVNFAKPVAVKASTTYIVSYFAPKGYYACDLNYFTGKTSIGTGPVHALGDGVDGPNGVYAYAKSSAFPTATYLGTNYWVDPVYSPSVAGVSLPNAPSGLGTTAVSTTTISLTWSDNSSDETGFKIERQIGTGAWVQIATTAAGVNTYDDTTVTAGASYGYRVRATNAGGDSAYSNTLSVSTPAAPAAPSGLSATAASDTEIDLAWTDNSSSETGFKIERQTHTGAWVVIATVDAGVTAYHDTGLLAGLAYTYRVRASNAVGDSAPSNTDSATTLVTPTAPAAPTSLSATSSVYNQMSLSWSDNSSNETGFKVERMNSDGTFSVIATVGANVTVYTDTGLTADTSYTYRVLATNAVGDSTSSNTIASVTAAVPTAPAAPSDLSADASAWNQVDLSWTDNSSNEAGFKIERLEGSTWVEIASVGANVTSYSDMGRLASTGYSYRVRATNLAGDSGYSNTAEAITPAHSDTVPPTGAATFSNITAAGDGTYSFTVTYADDVALDASSLGDQDILVTGPNGYSQYARLTGVTAGADGLSQVATYKILGSGSAWTSADNGAYTFTLQSNQVSDTGGNFAAGGVLGTMTVNISTADNAGDTRKQARNLGSFSPNRVGVYGDHIDGTDVNDYYRFTLSAPANVTIKLAGLSANANVQLRDGNNKVIASSTRGGTTNDLIVRLLNPGTYYIRVYSVDGVATNYTLRVASAAPGVATPKFITSPDSAGNSRAAARHTGDFAAGRISNYGDSVGPSDAQDFYRFEVKDTVDFTAKLSNLTDNVNMQLLSADGGLIQISGRGGNQYELINRQLTAGTYYLRLYTMGGTGTNYSLRMTAA